MQQMVGGLCFLDYKLALTTLGADFSLLLNAAKVNIIDLAAGNNIYIQLVNQVSSTRQPVGLSFLLSFGQY